LPVPAADVGSEVDVDRESPFAWLSPADGRLGVFVPLLMGAGVILSAISFVVEKLAGAVGRSGSNGPAIKVGPGLPAGGLMSAGPSSPPPSAPVRRPSAVRTGLVVVLALAMFPAIGLVADATQSRPDPSPDRVTVELSVWARDARDGATEEAGALWAACRSRIRLDRIEVTATGSGSARMVLTGVMGEHTRRRLTGCLEDATLDGVRAQVVGFSSEPVGVPLAPGQA
jgi:hypothetical protein